jgi:pSer/pThr/pTyr-binding forkhead associated (FHA) protein
VVIGRSDECDVIVDDGYVSRRHAEIRHTAAGWCLVDLSLNGTLVNGVTSTGDHVLTPGDRITVGSRTIRVEPGR